MLMAGSFRDRLLITDCLRLVSLVMKNINSRPRHNLKRRHLAQIMVLGLKA
jgi:hypothetical protein